MKVKRSLVGFHNASGMWVTLTSKIVTEDNSQTIESMSEDAREAIELLGKGDTLTLTAVGEEDGLSKWRAESQFIRLKDFSIIKSITEIIQNV